MNPVEIAPFLKAATSIVTERQLGENDHPELTLKGLSNNLLGFSDKFIRGLSEDRIREFIEIITKEAKETHNVEILINMFVLAFQTRWCRGGKGEKLVFYTFLKILYEIYPETVLKLLPLIPHYGYWKDLLELLVVTGNKELLVKEVVHLFTKQLKEDEKQDQITWCAKWAPSVGKLHDRVIGIETETRLHKITDLMGRELFPDTKIKQEREKLYRKHLAKIRAKLDVPEIKMCANRWDEIKFAGLGKVTSMAVNRYHKAFANEVLKGSETRHPGDITRITCRENFLSTVKQNKISGARMGVPELTKQAYCIKPLDETGILVINAQWKQIVQDTLAMIEARRNKVDHMEIDIDKMVVMSDVSGSMTGRPMDISIGLGILVSEICNKSWRNRVMTFSENPRWHILEETQNFVEKVNSLRRADWGGSTNFEAAMDQILMTIVTHKIPKEDVPTTLLVISDMQFNRANKPCQSWNTEYENIKGKFSEIGHTPPTIIFWNARSDTTGYPVNATQKGVIMLSGSSPALLKFVLSGELDHKDPPTPLEILDKQLYDEGLQPVRDILQTCIQELMKL